MPELPAPPEASSDPTAIELVRAWLIEDNLQSAMQLGAFEDPAVWGVVFADLAREVADGLKDQEGKDPAATLRQIIERFVEELTTGGGGGGGGQQP